MEQVLKIASTQFLITFILCACFADVDSTAKPAALPEPTILTTGIPSHIPSSAPIHIYTTQNNLLGNHIVEGKIDLQSASTEDIPLSGEPVWLVSAPFENGVVFVAVLDNGQTQAFKITGHAYESFEILPAQLPAGMPPLLSVSDDQAELIVPPQESSKLTNPLLLDHRLAYIAANGDLVLSDSASQSRLPIDALPDARILKDEHNRLLIFTGPTNRYDHGVLGDDMEASRITLIETEPELRVILNMPIEAPDVIEGISAVWADLDHDGGREIIVTLSNNQSGARIVAFREDGAILAEGAGVGLGHRWRHQIGVASFGPETSPLLIAIRTPHIGGVVEFYQRNGEKLEIVKEFAGFSAHSIGSRNLDSVLLGDFNDNGLSELLVPNQSHTSLEVISFDGLVTEVALDGVLTTNLSAAVLDGNLIIGAGTSGNLRIWLP